ncbi:unnamed protein product [Zymoseptoria tritici ST99CH_3D7]|uniref:Uncharacterized protein n=3 Tax=Zymoseptoria tritici TaxID=1047171 RepID=A0A1X7RZA7_ZYMT9|nr:unnamed protein product [Zymoseptoria tritici ST99CH_3D7]
MYQRGPRRECARTKARAALRPPLLSLPIHSFDSSVTRFCKQQHANMASATATATMAAAGFDKRSIAAASLQTPGSGTFPSEMLSPMAASPGLKREESLKTPITPPSAYLDFLKNMSPAVMSPASATSTRFSFNDKSFDRSMEKSIDVKPSIMSPPTSQPSLSRNTSYESDESNKTTSTSQSTHSTTKSSRPESPRIIIPPSPFAKPAPRSARTPRRLHIPQSPYTPALSSAHSVQSPYISTPLSSTPWSASFSTREGNVDAISQPGKVHVRHVVTRTVTYCRTPLDPAPKGKRRKIEVEVGPEVKAASEEPVLKQERVIEEESASSSETSAAETI